MSYVKSIPDHFELAPSTSSHSLFPFACVHYMPFFYLIYNEIALNRLSLASDCVTLPQANVKFVRLIADNNHFTY